MAITLEEYSLTCKLTKLRHATLLNFNDLDTVKSNVLLARQLVRNADLTNPVFVQNFNYILTELESLVERLESEDANSPTLGAHEFLAFLDTHFVSIDEEGSEVERISWLKESIDNLLDISKSILEQDGLSEEQQMLMKDCCGDIEVQFTDVYTEEMKLAVSNYPQFTLLVSSISAQDPLSGVDNSTISDTLKEFAPEQRFGDTDVSTTTVHPNPSK